MEEAGKVVKSVKSVEAVEAVEAGGRWKRGGRLSVVCCLFSVRIGGLT